MRKACIQPQTWMRAANQKPDHHLPLPNAPSFIKVYISMLRGSFAQEEILFESVELSRGHVRIIVNMFLDGYFWYETLAQ